MKVYADNAATTAMSKQALDAMVPCLEQIYGNPSSPYETGQIAAEKLFKARQTMARYLAAQPEEIYFTSGGTEADNWAIENAAALGAKQGKKHIISSKFEHHAVLHTLEKLAKQGFEITLLDVYENGIIHLEDLEQALRPDTALVTIMYANNEVGTIQPIAAIGKLCRQHQVLFHTDAVQAAGHLPIDVVEQQIDLLSLSAHKFHGPKGIGLLYCRKGIPLEPLLYGGGQERNKRAGTENVPAIVGMAAAFEASCQTMQENARKVAALRDQLIQGIAHIPAIRINGDLHHRLPGNANFCFEGVEGEALLLRLDLAGISCSSGSACTSGSLDPSHVLLAMGLPHEIAHGSLRLTFCETNTPEEIDYIITTLPPIVAELRNMSPVWKGRCQHGL